MTTTDNPEPHWGLTLPETIFNMVNAKQTDSKEFKALIMFYGRDKLLKLYREEQERRKAEHGG